jgi:hypothetical protein
VIEVTPVTAPDDRVGFTEPVPASYAGGLAWCPVNVTPGHYWFAYVSTDSEGSTDLYLGNTEQPGSIRLTQLPGREVHPTWSADGRDLAFVAAGMGNGDLYVVPNLLEVMGPQHAAPEPPIAVTEGLAVDTHPAFSPDGRRLLFSRNENPSTDYRLHVLDLDQVKPWGVVDAGVVDTPVVLDIEGQATRGTFSPDAKSVAFYHSVGAFDATVSLMAADVREGARWMLDGERVVARNVQPEGGDGPSWGPSRGRNRSGESARTLVYLQLTSSGVADLMVADLSASAGRRVRTKARVITGFDFAGAGRGAVTGQRGENYVAYRSHLLGSAFRAGWDPSTATESGGPQ